MAAPQFRQRRLTLVVLDDNADLLEAVVDLLAELDMVEVVGACTAIGPALDAVRTQRPDVVLLDAMLATGGHIAASRIRQAEPRTAVIAMATTDNTVLAEQLVRAGARACVVKERLAVELPPVLDDLSAEPDLPRSE